ncbi:MAG: regulatory protein RecX [Spirochaetaceae bacterium]|nr:MAG: regulatory protein RecX [Spirochaetaceae bacterium]
MSDGSFFLLPADSSLLQDLRAGMPADDEVRDRLAEEHRRHSRLLVYTKTLDLLAAREHSTQELSRKLLQRGYDADLVGEVLSECREAGYVDDRRFARAFVESRLRRQPEGRAVLQSRLAGRGVDRHICDEVLQELFSDEAEHDALQRAFEKARRRTDDAEKQMAALIRKGFPYGAVKAIVRNYESP